MQAISKGQVRCLTIAFTLFVCVFQSSPVHAWSEGGHHLVAAIAFDRMPVKQQAMLLSILAQHPRYEQDFKLPDDLPTERDRNRWLIGRAGYWPDIARRQPTYNRPTWHYELGPSLMIGDRAKLLVPERPGPLPAEATIQTQELHISQAIQLCKNTLRDPRSPASDRALAVCWIAHLVADAHQPCHAGSLYYEDVFPERDGDRGANRIITRQKGNLHALWDQLLGPRFSLRAQRRRIVEMTRDPEIVRAAELAVAGNGRLDQQVWLEESRQAAIQHVYTPEVLDPLSRVARRLVPEPETLDLSEQYLQNAGHVARVRALQAGYRLAETWRECLEE